MTTRRVFLRNLGIAAAASTYSAGNLKALASNSSSEEHPSTGTVQGKPGSSVPRAVDWFSGKPRVAIISDIGNEPDDQMSFVRLLLYSNEFNTEAMIASTSTWQKSATHPETMHALVRGYGKVRQNLLLMRRAGRRRSILTGMSSPGSRPTDWPLPAAGRAHPDRRLWKPPSSATIHVPCGSASGAAPTRWPKH